MGVNDVLVWRCMSNPLPGNEWRGEGILVEVDLILDLVALLQVLRPGCE